MNKWYVAFFSDDTENEYGKFANDEQAIKHFLRWAYDNGTEAVEIYECNDDECLTPSMMVYPCYSVVNGRV